MNWDDPLRRPEEKLQLQNFSPRLEIFLTWAGIALTALASTMVAVELGRLIWTDVRNGAYGDLGLHILFTSIVAALIYGGLVYQFARLKYVARLRDHDRASDQELSDMFGGQSRPLSFLVPAYKEEPLVVEMTLMSAALQDYPNRSVTLLLDDPPMPSCPADERQLAAMRDMPARLSAKFAPQLRYVWSARSAFLKRAASGKFDAAEEYLQLADLQRFAANWVAEQLEEYPATDSASALFADKVLSKRLRDLQRRVNLWCGFADAVGDSRQVGPSIARCEQEYARVVALFDVRFNVFERKRYENLSHEANKAMNLNAYLGLMGKRYREVTIDGRLHLVEVTDGAADVVVPHADYVITLDADSLLLPDYAIRLAHFIEQPGNERIAVVQTPYSAFPGADDGLERIAGATTDIQYIIHQGFTGYDATYWVGANALLRRAALEDIVEVDSERGYTIRRYIQDRTVIEDTESTIDLVNRGWRLHNYPERLAYSATPPDFGSLLIQRRRWANGGLIIVPKLWRRVFGEAKTRAGFGEVFMRLHYLVSITAVNLGLLILLAFPIASDIDTAWLPVTALAYFSLYMRDLKQLGYRGSDLLRVYALNLLLIPINLGGVFKSIEQGITKAKIPFGRTPKVKGRTAAPMLYVLAEYVLLASWLVCAAVDVATGRWMHAAFAVVNAAFLGYAVWAFVGVNASIEDVSSQFAAWRQRRSGVPEPVGEADTAPTSEVA